MSVIANLIVRIAGQTTELQQSFVDAKSKVAAFDKSVGDMGKNLVQSLGVGLSVGAITAFVGKIADAAGNIVDLSEKLGMSTDAIQRFQFIADQSGTTIDAIAKASFGLGNALAGGDKGVEAGLRKIGLSFQQLWNLNPEERMDAVAIAASRIGDATDRNRALTEIFGAKTAGELAKAISGWEELGSKANIAGKDQVASLESAGDKAAEFYDRLEKGGINALGTVIGWFDTLEQKHNVQIELLQIQIGQWLSYGDAVQEAERRRQLAQNQKDLGALTPGAPALFQPESMRIPPDVQASHDKLNTSLKDTIKGFDDAAKKAKEYADANQRIKDLDIVLTAAEEKQIDVLRRKGATAGDIATVLHLNAVAVQDYVRWQDQLNASIETEIPLLKVSGQEWISRAANVNLFGRELIPLVERSSLAGSALESMGGIVLTDLQKTQLALQSFRSEWELMTVDEQNWYMAFHGDLPTVANDIRDVGQGLIDLGSVAGGTFGTMIAGVGDLMIGWKDLSTQTDKAYSSTEKIMMLLQGAAAVWGATGPDKTPGQGAASGAMAGASAGMGIGFALSGGNPLGAAIGAGIGAIAGGITGLIRGVTEYEQRVRDAAVATQELIDTATSGPGGLERLRHQFSIVGIQIDEAFKSRDPKWIKEVLEDGYSKTQLLNDAMKEYGFTWENLGAEGRALQLGDLLLDLKSKTEVLRQAGVDYDEVLRRQAGSYSDLVVKAINTNTEIDVSMKPILQKLVDMGELVDASGNKLTDLEDITWSTTLTQGFDKVTLAIKELTAALTKDVGGALDTLGKRKVTIPVRYDVEAPPSATGGRVPIESPSQTITVNLDSDPIVRATVRGMPSELELNGV